MAFALGRQPLIIARPQSPATDRANDALLAARALLKRAIAVQHSSELQTEQLRALVDRLEAERRRNAPARPAHDR